jgi:rod shape-determining protein MreD
MALTHHQGGWIITLTFVVALMLTILPLPDWAQTLRPQWMALALIYWCIALPDRVGVVIGWMIGLITDVASGALMGQNAIAFALLAYLAIKLHLRMRLFPLWQQAMSIMILIALFQMITLWIRGTIGQSPPSWSYWYPSLTSMLLWPVVFMVLRGVRRQFNVR